MLVQHREINDTDTGGRFTVKIYNSEKTVGEDGEWQHQRIVLKPDTSAAGYSPIILAEHDLDEFKVLAEFIAVL